MIHHSERSTRQCVHCTTSSFLENIVVIMVEMVNVVVMVIMVAMVIIITNVNMITLRIARPRNALWRAILKFDEKHHPTFLVMEMKASPSLDHIDLAQIQ